MDFWEKVLAVNLVVQQYFKKHPRETKIPAKDLMPEFVKHGIFPKDHRNGLPIRKLLRDLDKNNQLKAIPFAFAERGAANTNWFFVRSSKSFGSQSINKPTKSTKTSSSNPQDKTVMKLMCLISVMRSWGKKLPASTNLIFYREIPAGDCR